MSEGAGEIRKVKLTVVGMDETTTKIHNPIIITVELLVQAVFLHGGHRHWLSEVP